MMFGSATRSPLGPAGPGSVLPAARPAPAMTMGSTQPPTTGQSEGANSTQGTATTGERPQLQGETPSPGTTTPATAPPNASAAPTPATPVTPGATQAPGATDATGTGSAAPPAAAPIAPPSRMAPTRSMAGTPAPAASDAGARLTSVLESSRQIQRRSAVRVTVQNETAIVRGRVATDRDRAVAEAMIRLEPGVWHVQNELAVESPPAFEDSSTR